MSIDIVIARYTEPLDWLETVDLSPITRIFIYNKNNEAYTLPVSITNKIPSRISVTIENLPNVGRESHTYLHHIIKMYELNNFCDKVIFVQGRFSDHVSYDQLIAGNNFYRITNVNNQVINFREKSYGGPIRSNKHNVTALQWIKIYVDKNIESFIKRDYFMKYGACFNIDKQSILSRPLASYKELITTLDDHSNPEDGHFFERSWYYIFNLHLNKVNIMKNNK